MRLVLLLLGQAADVSSRWAPPRLISIPALLVLAALASVVLFSEIEGLLYRGLSRRDVSGAADLAQQRTRLLSSFVAINVFFWFADPTLGLWAGSGGQLVRSLVLVCSAIWVARGWKRSADIYRRETLGISLRKQLQPFEDQLKPALDGRSLSELMPSEVFLLARVLPGQERRMASDVYRNVLEDLLRAGRLDSASALLYLQDLRDSLNLGDQEHHAAMRDLLAREPHLMALSPQQQQALDLRMAAAKEALADLIDLGSHSGPLQVESLTPRQRQRLERTRRNSGLDDEQWADLLAAFGANSGVPSPLLQRCFAALEHLLVSRQQLEKASGADPLLLPLVVALDLQILSALSQLLPAITNGLDRPSRARWLRLRGKMHVSLESRLALRGLTLPVLSPDSAVQSEMALPVWPDPPSVEDVLRELWQDPDPATAAWALRCLQRRDFALASAVQRQPRLGTSAGDLIHGLLASSQDLSEREQSWCRRLADDPVARQCTPAALLQ